MKRFCCSSPAGQTTVLAFDKTFNLTEIHVTMAVYNNLALYRDGTQNHPIMLGPMFIHGTSDYDTYCVFFEYLKRKTRQCSSQPVLGSDDETAMRKAMKDAFPESGTLVCERHLQQNAADYLTNNVGVTSVSKKRVINSLFGTQGLSDAADLVTFELRSDTARGVISENAPGFMDYYSSRIHRLMKDNLQVSINQRINGLDCAHWMNNGCESANHQLKILVDWKSKSLTQLVDALYKEVQSQRTGVERAFIDRGHQFTLVPEFAHYRMHAHVYEQKTDKQKEKRMAKFLREYKPVHPRAVSSDDGRLTVLKASNGGKKPGQTKRKRCARTRTVKKHCA